MFYNGTCQWCNKLLYFDTGKVAKLKFNPNPIRPFNGELDLNIYFRSEMERKKRAFRHQQYLAKYFGAHIHHIKPRYNGGTNNPSNLILMCPVCHRYIQAWLYFVELNGWT